MIKDEQAFELSAAPRPGNTLDTRKIGVKGRRNWNLVNWAKPSQPGEMPLEYVCRYVCRLPAICTDRQPILVASLFREKTWRCFDLLCVRLDWYRLPQRRGWLIPTLLGRVEVVRKHGMRKQKLILIYQIYNQPCGFVYFINTITVQRHTKSVIKQDRETDSRSGAAYCTPYRHTIHLILLSSSSSIWRSTAIVPSPWTTCLIQQMMITWWQWTTPNLDTRPPALKPIWHNNPLYPIQIVIWTLRNQGTRTRKHPWQIFWMQYGPAN